MSTWPFASASVETQTVFSGAGKFMEEAPSAGAALLRMLVRCHVNYGYWFIRPTIAEVIARYNQKHHPERKPAGVEPAQPEDGSAADNGNQGEGAELESPVAGVSAASAAAAAAAAGAVAKAAAEAALSAGANPAAAAAAAQAAVAQM